MDKIIEKTLPVLAAAVGGFCTAMGLYGKGEDVAAQGLLVILGAIFIAAALLLSCTARSHRSG